MFFSFVLILLWLLLIRPYCRRNGKGYTPGATLDTSAWINWQEATETARLKGDRWMLWMCRLFLALQIFIYATMAALIAIIFLTADER